MRLSVGAFLLGLRNLLGRECCDPLLLFVLTRDAFTEKHDRRCSQADHQGRCHRRSGGEDEFVSPESLLKTIGSRWWPCEHRLVAQMPIEIRRQTIGCLVATGPVLL